MKQSKSKFPKPVSQAPSLTKELALEFVRISKLKESGKPDEAWRAANALHTKHPNEATPNFVMALMLVDKEQNLEALSFAKIAARLAPDNAVYQVFLGKLYVNLGMIEFAPDILHKAYALDRTQFRAPWALAHYYHDTGLGSRALPYFDLALRSAPAELIAAIRMSRAACLRAVGRVVEAEADYRSAMAAPQHRAQALVAIALLQKNDHTSDYAEQVRNELELPDQTAKKRSALYLCLGRLYENGGDYDNAFLNFDRSRKLLHQDPRYSHFPSQGSDASSVLSREVFEKFKDFGNPSEKPIFVVGMPRSGTTMTEQIIAAHSQAEGVGELFRMSAMAKNLSGRGGMQQVLDKMVEVGPERWKEVPGQYMNLLDALALNARRTVDKLPHNFLWLGFIHLCFPNAKIIHCKRNPLDNFISAFQNQMSAFHAYSYDQKRYGEYYINYLQLMDHWKAVLPGSIYESRYEVLTSNPEAEIRNILDFLGLPWDEACLRFNERESTIKTFSQLQVRNPINTGSVARWRNYEKHLAPLIAVLEQAGVEI